MKNVTFSWNLYCFLAPKICLHELPPFKLKLKGNCDNLFSCKILKTFFFFLHIRLHLAWLPQDPLENLLKKRCLGIGFWFLLALFAIVWLLLAPWTSSSFEVLCIFEIDFWPFGIQWFLQVLFQFLRRPDFFFCNFGQNVLLWAIWILQILLRIFLFSVITVSRTITVGTLKMMSNSMPARPPMISTSRPLLTKPGKHPIPEF